MNIEVPDHVAEALRLAADENGCAPEDGAVAMLEELLNATGFLASLPRSEQQENPSSLGKLGPKYAVVNVADSFKAQQTYGMNERLAIIKMLEKWSSSNFNQTDILRAIREARHHR